MDLELEIKRDDKIKELLNGFKSGLGKRVKVRIESDRFPYTYAYDFKRLGDGSRSDTGIFIRDQYGDDIEGYAKEMLSRAFGFLFTNYAQDFLNDILDEKSNTGVKNTYCFIRDVYIKN